MLLDWKGKASMWMSLIDGHVNDCSHILHILHILHVDNLTTDKNIPTSGSSMHIYSSSSCVLLAVWFLSGLLCSEVQNCHGWNWNENGASQFLHRCNEILTASWWISVSSSFLCFLHKVVLSSKMLFSNENVEAFKSSDCLGNFFCTKPLLDEITMGLTIGLPSEKGKWDDVCISNTWPVSLYVNNQEAHISACWTMQLTEK